MHRVLTDIQIKILNGMREDMPEISSDALEEGGKVYYMNGKNGTEYDWFVNDHLPTFMVFYNDEKNLGAAKATVYTDGGMVIYLYDEKGEHLAKEVQTFLEIDKSDLLKLAVCLRCNADDKKIWDAALDRIESDILPDESTEAEFLDNRKYYEPGDEDDEYINNVEHVELCKVYSIAGIDPAVINHIDNPVGTRLIRKSSEEFEVDRNQPVFMEKWK